MLQTHDTAHKSNSRYMSKRTKPNIVYRFQKKCVTVTTYYTGWLRQRRTCQEVRCVSQFLRNINSVKYENGHRGSVRDMPKRTQSNIVHGHLQILRASILPGHNKGSGGQRTKSQIAQCLSRFLSNINLETHQNEQKGFVRHVQMHRI